LTIQKLRKPQNLVARDHQRENAVSCDRLYPLMHRQGRPTLEKCCPHSNAQILRAYICESRRSAAAAGCRAWGMPGGGRCAAGKRTKDKTSRSRSALAEPCCQGHPRATCGASTLQQGAATRSERWCRTWGYMGPPVSAHRGEPPRRQNRTRTAVQHGLVARGGFEPGPARPQGRGRSLPGSDAATREPAGVLETRREQAGQGAATWRAGIAARGQRDPCPPQRLCPAVACQPRARALRARGAHRSLLARSWSTSVWGDWDFLCNPLRGLCRNPSRVNPLAP